MKLVPASFLTLYYWGYFLPDFTGKKFLSAVILVNHRFGKLSKTTALIGSCTTTSCYTFTLSVHEERREVILESRRETDRKRGREGGRERDTDFPAYSDTLGTRKKCHCKRGVTVTTSY